MVIFLYFIGIAIVCGFFLTGLIETYWQRFWNKSWEAWIYRSFLLPNPVISTFQKPVRLLENQSIPKLPGRRMQVTPTRQAIGHGLAPVKLNKPEEDGSLLWGRSGSGWRDTCGPPLRHHPSPGPSIRSVTSAGICLYFRLWLCKLKALKSKASQKRWQFLSPYSLDENCGKQKNYIRDTTHISPSTQFRFCVHFAMGKLTENERPPEARFCPFFKIWFAGLPKASLQLPFSQKCWIFP